MRKVVRLTLRWKCVEGIRSYVALKIMTHVEHSSITYTLISSNIYIRLFIHIKTPKHGQTDTSTQNQSNQLTILLYQKRGGFVGAESRRLEDNDDDTPATVGGTTGLRHFFV